MIFNTILKAIGKEDRYEEWYEMKDKIPNLQIMEERKNRVKNKRPFKEWPEMDIEIEKKVYLEENYIPLDISYDIKDFEEFYNKRKEILRVGLKKILLGVSND